MCCTDSTKPTTNVQGWWQGGDEMYCSKILAQGAMREDLNVCASHLFRLHKTEVRCMRAKGWISFITFCSFTFTHVKFSISHRAWNIVLQAATNYTRPVLTCIVSTSSDVINWLSQSYFSSGSCPSPSPILVLSLTLVLDLLLQHYS